MKTIAALPSPRFLSPFRVRSVPSFPAMILVAGIAPMALDTYMPAMPQMAASLHTTAAVIQLTVTAYFLGMAIGQLVAGPASDVIGRRPVLLVPAVVFTLASVVCATVVSPDILVITRLVHGIAAGALVTCGRTVVADRYRGSGLATRFGTLTATAQVGPVVAPALGCLILAFGDWRTIFWFMAVLGVVMTWAIVTAVPETLPTGQRHGAGLRPTIRRMTGLLARADFRGHVIISCLVMFGFYIYVGGASFVLQAAYGISVSLFALIFGVNSAMIGVGSIAYRVLVTRTGPARLRNAGIALALAAVITLVVAARPAHLAPPPLALTWVLLAVVTGAMGLVIPASMTLGQQAGDAARGTAASLQGGLTQVANAIATPMTGLFAATSLFPMAVMMTAGFAVGAVAMVAVARSARPQPAGCGLAEASDPRAAGPDAVCADEPGALADHDDAHVPERAGGTRR